jgi:hypothetical protein
LGGIVDDHHGYCLAGIAGDAGIDNSVATRGTAAVQAVPDQPGPRKAALAKRTGPSPLPFPADNFFSILGMEL